MSLIVLMLKSKLKQGVVFLDDDMVSVFSF
jgi:hypothetical protein